MSQMSESIKNLEHEYKSNPTPSVTERLVKAYLESKQYQDALTVLDEQTLNYPQNTYLKRLYADILRLTGNYDKAMIEYQKVTSKTGQDGNAWLGLAETHSKRGEWVQAMDCFRQVIEIMPLSEEGWFGVQKCLQMLGQNQSESPSSKVATATMAEIYEQQGLTEKALEIYRELAKSNPTYNTKIRELEKHE
jgi:tetratricopeptide (TPR) repeat protein